MSEKPVKPWHYAVMGILAVAAVASFLKGAGEPAPMKWYEGGTLHDQTMMEWRKGTAADRLATASDWTATYIGFEKLTDLGGFPVLRKLSVEVVACLDATGAEPEIDRSNAATIAVMCMTMMNYKNL